MPTDSTPLTEIRRLAAARDEALQRYTQHLAAIQLRNSRWSILWSPGRAMLRSRLWSASNARVSAQPHAH